MNWLAMRTVIAAVALTAVGLSAAEPARTTYRAKVEGSTFRVTVEGDTVTVANKAVITGRTVQVRTKMRAAVKVATGCEIIDELWVEAVLKGILDCSATDAQAAPADRVKR